MRSVVAYIVLLIVGSSNVFAQATEPDIDVTPGSFNFGTVAIGNSRDHAFAVSNEGTADLIVFATEIQGPDADQFRITNSGGFILRPGAVRLVSVRFTPSSVGPKSALLHLENNDPNENPLTVSLSGAGSGVPDISIAPASLSFGNVSVGSTALRDLIVTNQGTAALEVSATELLGIDAGLFALEAGGAPFTVAPQGRDTVTIRFTPASSGDKIATLRLHTNDPDESPFDVVLAGRGTSADIEPDSTRHDFGEVAVGAGATHVFLLFNQGETDLIVDSLALLGADADAFEVTRGGAPFTLRPGRTQQVTVQFAPTSGGSKNARLRFFSNDPDEPELDLTLLGTGLTAALAASRSSLDFGALLVPLDASRTLLLTNTGKADLLISRVSVSGGDSTAFVVTSDRVPFSIAPSDSSTIAVRFRPASPGFKRSTLRLVSNDPDRPQLDIDLSGTGTALEVDVAEAARPGEEVTVTFLLPPGFQPVEKTLFYRAAGEPTYRTTELTGTGPAFQGVIPGPAVTISGVQYYGRVSDGQQAVTLPVSTPESRPLFLPVRVDQLEAPVAAPAWTYRMIAVPLALDDAAVAAVLEDDYGPYNTRRWRVFRWEGGDYVEYPAIQASLTAGAGFWLITNDGAPFDVENGRSLDPSQPFTLTLQPGWNQIGNPFAFSLTWPGTLIDPRVEAPVAYAETDFQYGETTLRPWEGYFVRNLASAPLTVTLSAQGAPSNASKREELAARLRQEGVQYLLRLSATVEGLPLSDTQNYLGLAEGAREGHPALDFSEAPPIGDFIRLSIVEHGERYAGRFKPAAGDGQHWDLELDGTPTRASVRVRLAGQGRLPDGYGLYVLDQDHRSALALADSSFMLDAGPAPGVRHLRLILGTKDYAEAHRDDIPLVPLTFELEQNYPNPFNPSTAIRYRIGHQSAVRLEVYNIIGQRVRTLVDAMQQAGTYAVAWDGLNDEGAAVASGVYLYRLTTGDFAATRKMLLIR